jgi:hypothetical protein
VSVRRQPDKNAGSEVANKWDDYADPSISGALRKSLNFPRARQRIVFKLQLGLEPVSFCCTHIPNTPTLAIRLLRLYTLIREHLAFAAESLPSFSLHHHKDGPRPRRLLLYHHHHHHPPPTPPGPSSHPPTCLQSPPLHTTSLTLASCAPSYNGPSGTRPSTSAMSPRNRPT